MKKLNITSNLKKAGLNGAGGVAAAAINKITFVKNIQNKMLVALGKIGVAAFLPSVVGKGKSKGMVEDFSAGFAAVGGIELVNSVIAKNDPNNALGISGMPVIAGYGNPSYAINNGQDQDPIDVI